MKHVHSPWPANGRRAARPACVQAGFSVVEFMVAMAVGLLLLAGLVTLFVNSSRSGNELEKSVRQLENGRYALELLSEDIAMAGYFGEIPLSGATRTTPDACVTAAADLGFQAFIPLQLPVAVVGLTPTVAADLNCLDDHSAGTAALVVHRLETPVQPPGSNEVLRYLKRIYYIASCNECGVDNVPTLKRAERVGSAMVVSPLAEGIQDLVFEFGLDTDDDGEPDLTVLSADTNNWDNVVGVRVYLLSRATEASPGHVDAESKTKKKYDMGLAGMRGPFNDDFKRRAYTLTTRLNNVAGPREKPLPVPLPAQQP